MDTSHYFSHKLHVFTRIHHLCYVTIHNGTQPFYSDRLGYYSYEQVL